MRAAVAEERIRVVSCPSPEQVTAGVVREIDRLLTAGLRPGDVAVVSLRGRTAESAVLDRPRLGTHDVALADAADVAGRVVVDTFLRFKGLERPAVIVTDLGGVARTKHVLRMHIALTRALDLVRIVAEAPAVADDPVLAPLATHDD